MPQSTAPRGYSLLQIVLHWAIAALVIFQLVVNQGVQDAFKDRIEGRPIEDIGAALPHVAIGMLILVLAVIRLAIRLRRGAPEAHRSNPAIINLIGLVAHWLLYGFIFLMPVTGALAWFGGVELSAELHEMGRLVLIPLIGLHALGGLAEHFVFRNDALIRMLKPERQGE